MDVLGSTAKEKQTKKIRKRIVEISPVRRPKNFESQNQDR
jgi:hypothetical protein